MVIHSDISTFWRRWLSVLYIVLLTGCLLFVPESCKHKKNDKGETPQEMVAESSEAEFVDDLEHVNFSFSRVKGYFLGKIDGNAYVLSIEKANKSMVSGKYYRIDTLESNAHPERFKLLRTDDGYRLVAGAIDSPVTFSISADSTAILGFITTLGDEGRQYQLAFEHYRAPAFREAKSTRYREPQYTFTKTPDILYGKAKGYWTSYPMEDDTNYVRMIFKLLPKTRSTKN